MKNSKNRIDACLVCATECEECATCCINLNDKNNLKSIALCRDCADICALCARFEARLSFWTLCPYRMHTNQNFSPD